MTGGISYLPYFDASTDPVALAAAVTVCFGVPPERVHVGPAVTIGSTTPYVLIERFDDTGTCTLTGGDALARACNGLSERELTAVLCQRLGTSAFVAEASASPFRWYHVGSDGAVSRVIVDEDALDAGRLEIAFAYDPIPTLPDVEVRPGHEWLDWDA